MTVPICLTSASDLRVQINANGSLRHIDHRDVIVNLFPGNEVEGGPTNLYLRRRDASNHAIPLLGPASDACYRIRQDGFAARGTWCDVRFEVCLRLAPSAPGAPLAFEFEANPYRAGGAVVAMDALRARLAASGNTLVVTLR